MWSVLGLMGKFHLLSLRVLEGSSLTFPAPWEDSLPRSHSALVAVLGQVGAPVSCPSAEFPGKGLWEAVPVRVHWPREGVLQVDADLT